MKALQYTRIGSHPEVVEIEKPTPGPGQVLLKVTAAGVCHSDEFVMGLSEEEYTAAGYPLPLTLGHEGAGIVEELGEGVEHLQVGDAVAVYGPWGCGRCRNCAQGKENYCTNAQSEGIMPPGLGAPGSMAEYMIVDSARHLVPLGELDPVKNVSLTDAGLTPYHAIKTSLPKLGAGTTAVVIGTGGLGHVAIQLLRLLTPTRVIALDIGQDKLDFAQDNGAHEAFESNAEAADKVKGLTGGRGATVVLDFVGADVTGNLAVACGGVGSAVVVIGAGMGGAKVGLTSSPYNMTVSTSLWGRRKELLELVEMAKRGQISIKTTTYPIDDGENAYNDMHAGKIIGRAVVVP